MGSKRLTPSQFVLLRPRGEEDKTEETKGIHEDILEPYTVEKDEGSYEGLSDSDESDDEDESDEGDEGDDGDTESEANDDGVHDPDREGDEEGGGPVDYEVEEDPPSPTEEEAEENELRTKDVEEAEAYKPTLQEVVEVLKDLLDDDLEQMTDIANLVREELEDLGQEVDPPSKSTSFEEYAYSVPPEVLALDEIVSYDPLCRHLRPRFLTAEAESQSAARAISSTLRRILHTQSQTRKLRGQRSGRIDRNRLHTLNRPGSVHNDRIFNRFIQGKSQDVAIFVMVDQSGSMSGSPIKTARATSMAIGNALDPLAPLGLKFAVYGFDNPDTPRRSDFRDPSRRYDRLEPMRFHEYKAFTDDWKRVKPRIGGMEAGGNNCDPDALRFAAAELFKVKDVQRRILLVLSDGQPCCHTDLWRTDKDLKRVIAVLETRKIEVIGLGILTDYVKKYYPKWLAIKNLADLQTTGVKLLADLLLNPDKAGQKRIA